MARLVWSDVFFFSLKRTNVFWPDVRVTGHEVLIVHISKSGMFSSWCYRSAPSVLLH